MLELLNLCVDIQGSRVLHGVSLEVRKGELVCLVGRNGAGKTTTLRAIMGYRKPASGQIFLKKQNLLSSKVSDRAHLGIGFAPEGSEIFGDLTVAENIELPTWTRKTARSAHERIEEAYKMFSKLRQYMDRAGTHMSGGERKMLSIARVLSLDADLLLLDEPFEGLSPAIIPVISESIDKLVRSGRTVLIAESELHHVPEKTNRLYVLERGEIVFGGTMRQARDDVMVQRVLGGKF